MIRRLIIVLATFGVAALVALAAAAPASALGTADAPTVTFTVDPAVVVQFTLAVVLPVLVGLVTTRVTSSGAKAWLLASLTLVTSLLTELGRALTSASTFDLGDALFTFLPAFVISVAIHYGLWKPTGISEALKDVGRTAAETD